VTVTFEDYAQSSGDYKIDIFGNMYHNCQI
jgi:hypothetical protein